MQCWAVEATEYFTIYVEDLQSKILWKSMSKLTKEFYKTHFCERQIPIIQKTNIIPTNYPVILNICFFKIFKVAMRW